MFSLTCYSAQSQIEDFWHENLPHLVHTVLVILWTVLPKKVSYIRVSNGTGQPNFSGQRDRQKIFVPGQRDNGTEVPSLSRDKGTTGQPQNLTTGRDGPGQPKSGTGRGTKRDRAEKDVLKQKNDVLKQKMLF